jgi:hypothetical protein
VVLLRFPERRLQKRYERVFIIVMTAWLSAEAIISVTWPCWATPKNITSGLGGSTIERERSSRELSETLAHLVPTGVADRLRRDGLRIGQPEMVDITLLMSDIRGTQESPKPSIPLNWRLSSTSIVPP